MVEIPPQFTVPAVNIDTGSIFTYDANAFDAYDDTLNYQLIRGVPGMTIDSAPALSAGQPPNTIPGFIPLNYK